ncbi:endonuclease III domain-containing protein [Lacticaseibacillus brantae]|nr:endonuclease III [Lacticaseibacillus brantae]
MTKTLAREFFTQVSDYYLDATPTLNARNPFEIVVAVSLSAQTTDVAVNAVTPKLFAQFPTAEAMSQANVTDIENLIDRLGLYKNKAKHLKQMSTQLVTNYHGQVPDDFAALTSLAGVGQKTATVVLSDAFNHPGIAVDTHVTRIVKGFGLVKQTATPAAIQEFLEDLMPEDMWINLHRSLIRFGRQWLTARAPQLPPGEQWQRFADYYRPLGH